jgi:DNA-binding transcriptional LysR family regulator
MTADMPTLRQAALAGLGIAKLPAMMVRDHLADGTLLHVLPAWAPRQEVIHVAFPTRRGLIPAVRSLIDHLAERFGQDWNG